MTQFGQTSDFNLGNLTMEKWYATACSNDFYRFYHLSQNINFVKETREGTYGETYEAIRGINDSEKKVVWLTSRTAEIIDLNAVYEEQVEKGRLGLNHSDPRELPPGVAWAEPKSGFRPELLH